MIKKLSVIFTAAFLPLFIFVGTAKAEITFQEAYDTAAFGTYGNARDDFNTAFNPWLVYQCPHAGTCWNYNGYSLRSGARINPSLWLMSINHFATWSQGSSCEWRVAWNVAVREHADGSLYVTDKSRAEAVTKVTPNC
jgi:hypothetical protein